MRDIAVDVPLNPCCLQICIKASKTDPFQKGRNILIWPGSPPLCAVQPVVSFLERRGNRTGPCSFSKMAFLRLALYLQTDSELFFSMLVLPDDFSSHSFRNGAPLLLQGLVFRITLSKFSATGKAMLTNNIFKLLPTS